MTNIIEKYNNYYKYNDATIPFDDTNIDYLNIKEMIKNGAEVIDKTFDEAKQSKLAEIKIKRDEALNKNITFDSKVYKGTENARTLFLTRFNLNKFPLEWRLADDITWISLDITKATGLATAFLNDGSSVYQKETVFLTSLKNAKTIDDINKITVNY